MAMFGISTTSWPKRRSQATGYLQLAWAAHLQKAFSDSWPSKPVGRVNWSRQRSVFLMQWFECCKECVLQKLSRFGLTGVVRSHGNRGCPHRCFLKRRYMCLLINIRNPRPCLRCIGPKASWRGKSHLLSIPRKQMMSWLGWLLQQESARWKTMR